MPDHRKWGKVLRFEDKQIIYLNPFLEFAESDETIVGLVAHEIAHVLLGHAGSNLSNEEKEDEAESAVCDWGFEKEITATEKELFNFFKAPQQSDNTE